VWRYYLIATLLVFGIGSAVIGVRIASPPAPTAAPDDARVHSAPTEPPGLPGGVRPRGEPGALPFIGEGAWVLSALPACFTQQSSIEGSTQALRVDVPPARERIAPGTTFARGSCTVHVGVDDVQVERGTDRLRVPPWARLYRTRKGLVLVYEHDGNAEVRRY
jgi:hypothetical protein